MKESSIWVVRVPRGEEYIERARKLGLVSVGFAIGKSVNDVTDREEMKALYRDAEPGASEPRVATAVGQLYRVAHVIQPGDWILTPNRHTRTVLYGRVEGGYVFTTEGLSPELPHARRVKWLGEFSRDDMSQALRNSIGGIQTVLNMDEHRDEIMRLMKQVPSSAPGEPADTDRPAAQFHDEVRAKAEELIGDLIARLDPYDLQDLVAGLLEAMGYRTRVSPPGPDRGVDVVAHPDALGFESPRIKVQVKHRESAASGPDIRNLIGTLSSDEKGLFVSTGGFTRDAKLEAEKGARVTLLDLDELVGLLTEYYDKLDPDYKSLLPLRKVWVPAV
ncbi:MAG: restriction endonuclease [candidate division WOR-3 bacterium]